jgi:2'-5' RNA ligase
MLRLFAAIPVPAEIGQGLVRRQAGVTGARWSPAENFHVTLRFFGDVSEASAEDLDGELARIAFSSFDLGLEGAGLFGEGADIHAVWAGVGGGADLVRLAQACERAAQRAGLRAETRAFRPHVTLAYLKRPAPYEVAAWVQANNLLRSPAFPVRGFGLYSSHATKHGSRYVLERHYAAAGD